MMGNFSIKMKLLVLAIIPVMALLVISIDEGNRRLAEVADLEKLKKLVVLSTKISALVHETQKERGMTAGFIGSKGKKFADTIVKQRALSTKKANELKSFLTTINYSDFSNEFSSILKQALQDWSNISNIRKRVSALDISAKEAIGTYTAMNTKFLNTVYVIVNLSNNKDMTKRLTAYANYLLSKERAGIERAVGSNTFGRDNFGPGMELKWNNLILEQKLYMDLFLKVASSESKSFYSKTLVGNDINEVLRMRSLAFEYKQNFGVDATYWFKTITSKINKLKKVEDYLSKSLVDSIEDVKSETYSVMIFHLSGALFMMMLTLIISRLIVGNILDSIERFQVGLNSFFDFVNDPSISSSRISLDSKDEIGQMAKVVNQNIQRVENDIVSDKQFIKDVSNISSKVSAGFYENRITQNSNDASLLELKRIFNEMFEKMDTNNKRVLSLLKSFSNSKYIDKLDSSHVEGSLKELFNDLNYLGKVLNDNSYTDLENGYKLQNSSSILEKNLNELKNDAISQADSVRSTTDKINEVLENIHKNKDVYNDMIKLAKSVEKSSKDGSKLAHSTSESMDEIRNDTKAIEEAIEAIDQIAFQTNILSLNAAVEAATAGEAGKGFAVVAGEVRNLAGRSTETAKEIKALVQKAIDKTDNGKDIAHKMAIGYDELNSKIVRTIDYIQDVTNTNSVQTDNINIVNDGLVNVDKLTEHNLSIINDINELSLQSLEMANTLVEETKSKEFIGKDKLLRSI
jgi:methyl-accepting chemotaxis protein